MMHGAAWACGSFGGHLFEMADANHDGRVSLQEARPMLRFSTSTAPTSTMTASSRPRSGSRRIS